jgi:hypothetical protein
MDFVWLYAKKFSAWDLGHQFNELDYSIRSVRKNYQGEVRCFVVGDDPELDVIHIPNTLVERDDLTGQPRVRDHLNKYLAIIDSEVNEEFVLIWDDVFILQPTTEEEIKTVYGRCEVTNPSEYIRTRVGGTPYKRIWVDTYDHILIHRRQKGLKTYDWETHLPRFMAQKRLKWLINTLFLRDIPKLVTGLYQAYFSDETKLMYEGLQSDIYTHDPKMDFDKEFACKYMNIGDSVIVPSFVKQMEERFGK